jgi:hypothetical protein
MRTPTATHETLSQGLDDEERILAISQQISTLQAELNMLLMRRKGAKPRSSAPAPSAPVAPSAESVAQPAHSSKQKKSAAQLEEDLKRPMTFEEKRQLSNDVNELPPDKLFKVVEIIHDSMPNLRENADSDVIELDVETLDVRTLRKLQKYVRECNKKRKAKPSVASGKKAHTMASSAGTATTTAAAPSAEAVPFPVESSDESSDESGDE